MVKKFFRDHPVHKKIVPFLDYFFLLRPTYFFAIWITFSLGLYSSQFIHSKDIIWGLSLSLNSIMLIIGITFFCSGCFINWQLNSETNFPLQHKVNLINDKINPQYAVVIQYILFSIGTLMVFFSDLTILPFLILIIFFCTSFINKRIYDPGIVELFALGSFVYLTGFIHNHFLHGVEIGIKDLKILIPYLFLINIISNLLQIDRTPGGIITSSFHNFVLVCLCIVSGMFGLILNDPITSTASITIFPFLMMVLIRNNNIDLLRAIRYSLLILAVFVFTTYPQFIWFSVGLYFLSKYYYWHRFDFHYPKLVLENDRNYSK